MDGSGSRAQASEAANGGHGASDRGSAQFTWECLPVCGDGIAAGTEQCDDGNLDALDGCPAAPTQK